MNELSYNRIMKYALQHYYGDIVRYLFLTAGIIMLLTLPIFQSFIGLPVIFSILAIAGLGIAAGLTNPQQFISAAVNFAFSVIGFVAFAYSSVDTYQNPNSTDKLLITNLLLATIFLFALYFSMKTLRAQMLTDDPKS
jgi:prepilin signal peptidase PulO-like enzyme (type II secretory pathway)